MPWSAGTFTRTYGSTGWQGDAAAGTPIVADRHDTNDQDLATGVNACLNKDGSNSMTANLNMGGFIPTNLGAGTAAAPAVCPGNDQDTGMFSPAANTLAFGTNGTEAVRIDSSGRVGIGTTNPASTLEIQSTSANLVQNRFSANALSPQTLFRKSRGATVGTNTIVQSGDVCGAIVFQGANGTDYTTAAQISAEIDGTPSATNDMPGRLIFSTVTDGTSTLTERMRITNTGQTQLSGNLVFNTTSTAAGTGIYASGANVLNFSTNSLNRGSIDASGFWLLTGSKDRTTAVAANCHIDSTDGGIYRSTSSIKYKTEVADYTKGLEELKTLRPVTYKGINNGDTIFAGLIAEEVHNAGLSEFVMYDSEQEPEGLAYGNMMALAVKAIKELSDKLDALTERVEALEV